MRIDAAQVVRGFALNQGCSSARVIAPSNFANEMRSQRPSPTEMRKHDEQ
ncbi:MAG: hypothetical protein ABI619_03650 [Betaproteobacteria bacterium]